MFEARLFGVGGGCAGGNECGGKNDAQENDSDYEIMHVAPP
jgi:hypothetical protein